MQKLAIFDFDGTITTRDSFKDFIIYCHGIFKTCLGCFLLSPIILAYLLKILPNWKAKQFVFSYFFREWDESLLNKHAEEFSNKKLPRIVKESALNKIHWHKQKGHKVIVVSASFECYLKHWCDSLQIDLLGTKAEIKNGKITGRFATKNCYGDEKVRRLEQALDLEGYDYIYAYGDSKGDNGLKRIANEFHYRNFH